MLGVIQIDVRILPNAVSPTIHTNGGTVIALFAYYPTELNPIYPTPFTQNPAP